MLTDDFADKKRAVGWAFHGLIAGEQEMSHLLRKVRSDRSLRKALPDEADRRCKEHLFAALYNTTTKAGCEETSRRALDIVPHRKRAYLQKEWWKTREDWARYLRAHPALLLSCSQPH